MRSFIAKHNQLAVSAENAETAINTEQTLDTGMLVDLDSMFALERRRESNVDEATGKEEPDTIYDLGQLASMEMSFTKGQPQHVAFLAAYALGAISSNNAGNGFEHTITPIEGDLDVSRSNPSFTAAMRYGKHLLKRRFSGCFVDSLTLSLKKDSWMSVKGSIKATGKQTTNMTDEVVTAAYNATALTLAANGVVGTTAQERLDNVHAIKVQVPTTEEWVDVAYSVVSSATPAVITITAPGAAGTSTSYKVIYNAAEVTGPILALSLNAAGLNYLEDDVLTITQSGAANGTATVTGIGGNGEVTGIDLTTPGNGYAVADGLATTGGNGANATVDIDELLYSWCSFPNRISESPLRVTDFVVNIGGKWDGSAITGGHNMSYEVKGIEWSFANNLSPEFTPGAGSGAYANRALRTGRVQKITIDRDFRDYILGQMIDDNEDIVIHAIAEGAEFDTGHNYTVELIFPKVRLMDTPYSIEDGRLVEKGDFLVMEDDTYGSVVVLVKNLVSTYAA